MLNKFIKLLLICILLIFVRIFFIGWLEQFIPTFHYLEKFNQSINNIHEYLKYQNKLSGKITHAKVPESQIAQTIADNPATIVAPNWINFNSLFGVIILIISILWKFYKGKLLIVILKNVHHKSINFWTKFQTDVENLDKKFQDCKNSISNYKNDLHSQQLPHNDNNLNLSDSINNFQTLFNDTFNVQLKNYTDLVLNSLQTTNQLLSANNLQILGENTFNTNIDKALAQDINKINLLSENIIVKLANSTEALRTSNEATTICQNFLEKANASFDSFLKHNSEEPSFKAQMLVQTKKLLEEPQHIKKIENAINNLIGELNSL